MNKNKLIFIIVIVLLGILFIVTTCFRNGEKSKVQLPPGTHGTKVTEVIQTSNYTYLQVEENDTKFWIAIVSMDAKPGDSIYYTRSAEMKDFTSKELNRTFPSIFFVDDPSKHLVKPQTTQQQPLTPQKPKIVQWSEVSVITPKGGITISDLYKNLTSFSGKKVIIRGKVVKYNHDVMHKNWVHIQDGTEFNDKFDLTVTTLDSLSVGLTVTFNGIIMLDKDFGSGYKYEVIMEEAKASDIKQE